VIQVEDFGDQVVPNPSNEALAVAAGLPIFDPFVRNLHQNAFVLPIANYTTPGTLHANAASGAATAALLQNGPATHAASVGTAPGTVTFVPEFAHVDDFLLMGNGFPTLERGIRVPNAGILDAVLAWFADIVAGGPPGTFTFSGAENFNPAENLDVPACPSTAPLLAPTVDQHRPLARPQPTSRAARPRRARSSSPRSIAARVPGAARRARRTATAAPTVRARERATRRSSTRWSTRARIPRMRRASRTSRPTPSCRRRPSPPSPLAAAWRAPTASPNGRW